MALSQLPVVNWSIRKYDEILKRRKTPLSVIPAKAGHVVALFKPDGATLSAIQ